MKEVSTVAAKQSRNFSERKLTIGFDLGDRSSWYCVLDEAGEIVLEQKLGTTPKAMKEVFGGMPRSRIAIETGMHSPWVSRNERSSQWRGSWRGCCITCGSAEKCTNRCTTATRERCRQPPKTKTLLRKEKQKPKAEFR